MFSFTAILSILTILARVDTGPVYADIPEEWSKTRRGNTTENLRHSRVKRASEVEIFFEDEQNQATYIVLPLLVLVYGGCSSIYCIYKCRRYLKRQRSRELNEEKIFEKDDSRVEDFRTEDTNVALMANNRTMFTQKSSENISEIFNLDQKSKSKLSDDHFIENIEMVPLDDFGYENKVELLNNEVSDCQSLGRSETDRQRTTGSKRSVQTPMLENRKHTSVSRVSEIFVVADENNPLEPTDKVKYPHMPDVIPTEEENTKLIIKRKKPGSRVYLA